ncbi:MAG TPA: hypothetical protein VKZ97_01675 [Flavobacteriaceae bacterium]|nr:hypothetical protein [Flavobacteriaceae bacterium]
MKILLIGEYNSCHYGLKEALTSLGHNVTVIGHGDGFKNRTVDIRYNIKYTSGISFYIKRILYRLFKIDITSNSIYNQVWKIKDTLTGYDIVQLINESPFNASAKIEKRLLKFVFENNKNIYLLSCGTDYVSVKYAFDKKFKYSILTPYFDGKGTEKEFWHATKYITTSYKKLHDYVYSHINGVIASDLDYHIPLKNHEKYLGLAPNLIDTGLIKYIKPDVSNKIIIFHGINRNNYFKKGNDIFEKALELIASKYSDKVEIITVENLPYKDYIKSYDMAHILLDQVYAYDQGFNALEAMAKGKVVFTGAEKEWLDYHNLIPDTVAINAEPNANRIAEKLEWLILNPQKILEISRNARAYIEANHDHIKAAKIYLDMWRKAAAI